MKSGYFYSLVWEVGKKKKGMDKLCFVSLNLKYGDTKNLIDFSPLCYFLYFLNFIFRK